MGREDGVSQLRHRKPQPPLPTPQRNPRAPKGERGDLPGATARRRASPLHAPQQPPGYCRRLLPRVTHRPGPAGDGAGSERPPPPSRTRPTKPQAVPPRTRPGFVTRLWGHRWDSGLDRPQPENTAPASLPLATQCRRPEALSVHRLAELSITARPSGKCSSEQDRLKGLGFPGCPGPSGGNR